VPSGGTVTDYAAWTVPLIALTLPADADEVWRHLREPELIRRWFGWEYDGLDDEIDLIFHQDATATGHELRWPDGDRIELAPQGSRTVIRIQRERKGGHDQIAEGWISFAHQLRFALEHHPGEPRTTLRLSGGRPRWNLPGDPYFASEHQVGAIVDGALLIVAAEVDRSASMTLSAYGTKPDEARWRAWWESGRP
jgi:uncharacterized protein YndB with AHSA1/START domain